MIILLINSILFFEVGKFNFVFVNTFESERVV